MLDSVVRVIKKYYPQTLFKEYKHDIKKVKQKTLLMMISTQVHLMMKLIVTLIMRLIMNLKMILIMNAINNLLINLRINNKTIKA